MNTRNETWQLDAFVDGELDLATQLQIERRVQQDAALRQRIDEARELRELVRSQAERHVAPAALRERIAAALQAAPEVVPTPAPAWSPAAAVAPRATPRPASSNASTLGAALQRWLGWRPLAASLSFAALVAVASNVLWLQSQNEERLADDVVASHVRAMLGQHLVDVSSSDHHTVKPFLSSKLGYSPPVDELALPGSTFVGGRVDYLDGRPVAALVYRQGEHVVNSFVWPTRDADRAPSFAIERGFRTAHWSAHGMTHWVVSDVNPEEFQNVVKAVQQTDSAR